MRNLGKVILHIPAREGSKRVPRKNMRLMNNKPMISYAIDASLKSQVTEEVYINTDSLEIIEYAKTNYDNVRIYEREVALADDKASSDEFNYDIIKKLNPDTLIMINPVCPLITAEDIQNALNHYKSSNCDTLITSTSTQMQTFCNGEPVNINVNEQLAPSQNNGLIEILNWAITIWDAKSFTHRMESKGFASLGEDRVLFNIEPIKAIKVSEEKDFIFAEQIIRCLHD
jgi:CMP-N-acetylneuraminic acid synthetase